jgi:hypothetical protein
MSAAWTVPPQIKSHATRTRADEAFFMPTYYHRLDADATNDTIITACGPVAVFIVRLRAGEFIARHSGEPPAIDVPMKFFIDPVHGRARGVSLVSRKGGALSVALIGWGHPPGAEEASCFDVGGWLPFPKLLTITTD